MTDQPLDSTNRFRFSLRAVLIIVGVLAMAFAWIASLRNMQKRLVAESYRARFMSEELQRSRDQVDDLIQSIDQDQLFDTSRVLYGWRLDGATLRGVTFSSLTNAFQKCTFRNCDLVGSRLVGGDCAFQLANFDGAKLSKAKLTGGAAAFQLATFVGADLTGATLTGGGASFQSASFEKATLVGAIFVADAQNLNISEARFEAADLSSLSPSCLQSCYFDIAPTYDAATKFPKDFDPVVERWRRVAD